MQKVLHKNIESKNTQYDLSSDQSKIRFCKSELFPAKEFSVFVSKGAWFEAMHLCFYSFINVQY